jgi:phosphatidylinositol phospholipase C delta
LYILHLLYKLKPQSPNTKHQNGRTKPAYLTLAPDRFTIYITATKFKNGKVGKTEVRRPLLRKVTSIGSNDDEADHENIIDIGSLDRLQGGQNTLRFELARKMSSRISSPRKSSSTDFIDLDPTQSLSIIFSNERTLDLMISDEDVTRDEVLQALQNLLDNYSRAKINVGNDVLLLRYMWVDVDKDRSDSINAHELSRLLNRINFHMKKAESDKVYNSFAKMIGLDRNDRRKGISFENAVTILHKFKRDSGWQIKPVKNIWFDCFGRVMNNGKDRTKVSTESFLKKFMLKKQGESEYTMEEVGSLFQRLNELEVADVASNLHLDAQDPNTARFIDKDRFEAYLYSKENGIFDPAQEQLHQSMDLSLTEYWINSSHNTYLTGDQFQSRSSVEMYMNALYRGCRCLELDCFDGHRDSQNGRLVPLVYHG